MFGDHRRPVRIHLGNGKTHIAERRHFFDKGIVAAGGLGTALDYVTSHCRAGQLVPIRSRPLKLPGRRPHDQRRICKPSAHYNVGAPVQRIHDTPAPEIGIGGDWLPPGLFQAHPLVHVSKRFPFFLEVIEPGHQVVTLDISNFRMHAQFRGYFFQSGGQGCRVQSSGIGHNPDILVQTLTHHPFHLF